MLRQWHSLPSLPVFQVVLPWVLATAIAGYATFTVGLFLYRRPDKIPFVLKVWLILCFFVLSPWRYFIFQCILFVTYAVQTWQTFLTSLILYLYVPFVFMLPVVAASLGIYYGAVRIYSKRPKFLTAATLFVGVPTSYVAATTGFFLLLPYLAQTIQWLPPGDVIRAVRGPVVYAFKYLGAPGYPMIRPIRGSEFLFAIRPVERHVADMYLKSADRAAFSRTITSEPLARPKHPPE